MSRGGLVRRFPVLRIRDFRLLLADRLIVANTKVDLLTTK